MEAAARHDALVALLRRGASAGVVPFSRLVEAALYAPGLGYYVAEPKHCGDNAAMIAFAAWSEPDRPSDVAPAPSLTVDQA